MWVGEFQKPCRDDGRALTGHLSAIEVKERFQGVRQSARYAVDFFFADFPSISVLIHVQIWQATIIHIGQLV